MPRVHISLSGHRLEYPDPTGAMAKFLRQLEKMLADPNTSADAMTGFAYSPANPMLDTDFFPERGLITKETFADPHYPVMVDMLARKRALESKLDVSKLAATYTMTVDEAAKVLGMHSESLRNAIQRRRIHSWVIDGRYYLNPAAVRAYEVGNQGGHRQAVARTAKQADAAPQAPSPPPTEAPSSVVGGPLDICLGHRPGLSFRVKHPGDLEDKQRVDKHIFAGRLPRWKHVAVVVGKEKPNGANDYRLYLLTPSDNENAVLYDPFYVRGRFDVVKDNNPVRADDKFKAFVAE